MTSLYRDTNSSKGAMEAQIERQVVIALCIAKPVGREVQRLHAEFII